MASEVDTLKAWPKNLKASSNCSPTGSAVEKSVLPEPLRARNTRWPILCRSSQRDLGLCDRGQGLLRPERSYQPPVSVSCRAPSSGTVISAFAAWDPIQKKPRVSYAGDTGPLKGDTTASNIFIGFRALKGKPKLP